MISKRMFLTSAASAVIAAGAGFIGVRPAIASQAKWNKGDGGYAADGADVVSYFSLDADARGVPGTDSFVTEWNGARWRFSSADTLATFKTDPARYAPKYGGYCAWA
ncbi:MAG: YHS domain-containing (seleno)protein, partial [Pseudomonadota bacterium]